MSNRQAQPEWPLFEAAVNPTLNPQALVKSRGLDHYSFMVVRPPRDRQFDLEIAACASFPEEWLGRYVNRRYYELDPVALTAKESLRPFFWGRGKYLKPFSKRQRKVCDEAHEFGISYGLTLPIRGPGGELSVFNLVSSSRKQLREAVEDEHGKFFAAAYDLHDNAMRQQSELMSEDKTRPVKLTTRERECLAWTLQGKTASDIADILKLSVSTVNHHALSASRKMDGINKFHAAVKALRSGLID